ncbi:ras-like small GTPase [Trypanosoma brucei equiperdum]|uniref:Ras-like small GTPase n=1 Tax=Trypanosoma brucei equiperdum TaxID=630700 RepID=A0A3L6L2C3_9TRYP|nr:ras-like small GTPase [Trypanosoma brucei equiperdum]
MNLRGDGSAQKYASVPTLYNVVVLGCERVGKSTFIDQVMKGTFRSDYVPTTLETFIHRTTVDGRNYVLHLCDSSGSEAFVRHRLLYLARADGVLLFYSTTDKESLAAVVGWVKELREARHNIGVKAAMPILLVGTKRDDRRSRVVTMPEAEAVARSCLSALSLKMQHMNRKKVVEAEGFAKLVRDAISSTLPVVEVSALRTNEVLHALRVMILMISNFSKRRLPAPVTLTSSIEFATPPSLTPCFTSFDGRPGSAFFRMRSPIRALGERSNIAVGGTTSPSAVVVKRTPSLVGVAVASRRNSAARRNTVDAVRGPTECEDGSAPWCSDVVLVGGTEPEPFSALHENGYCVSEGPPNQTETQSTLLRSLSHDGEVHACGLERQKKRELSGRRREVGCTGSCVIM